VKLLMAVLAVGLMACGSDSPTAPTPTPPLVPSDAPRLTGVVLDDRGAPIAGATVSAALGSSDETDEQGRFFVTTNAPDGVYFGLDVYKPGYEGRHHTYVRGPTEVITLHDVIRLPVGESVRVTIGPNDPVGGELEYRYRIVRIVSSTPTHLDVSVASDDGAAPDWMFNRGPCCPSPPSVVASIEDVGAELVAYLRVPWWPLVSRTYTVTTSRMGR
jgi:hypothetical protein